MNVVQCFPIQKLNPWKKHLVQKMTPSTAVGSLKKIGEWCIKQDDSSSKQFLRMKLFYDRNFHLKKVVLSQWKSTDSLLSECVRMEKFSCVEILRLTFELVQSLCGAYGVFNW